MLSLAAALTIGLIAQGVPAAEVPVEVLVEETGGVPRSAWPVMGGVPLPKGAVRDTDQLALKDGRGTPIPCQAEVVTRWPDGSAKWVMLAFQCTVAAGETARFTLDRGKPAAVSRPVTVIEGPETILINTGAIAFTVPKRTGAILAEVETGGRKVLAGHGMSVVGAPFVSGIARPSYPHSKCRNMSIAPVMANANCGSETWTMRCLDPETFELVGSRTGADGKGPRKIKDIWTSKSGAISVRPSWLWEYYGWEVGPEAYWTFQTDASHAGVAYHTPPGHVERAVVESRGPLVATVYLEGTFATEKGVAYDQDFKYRCRIYAYAGRPFIYLVPGIVHVGPYDAKPAWRFLSLGMQFACPEPMREADLDGATGQLTEDGASLFQSLGAEKPYDAFTRRAPHCRVVFGGQESKTGKAAIGSMVARGAAGQVGVAIRRFREYAPKGMSVTPSRIDLSLLPRDEEAGIHHLGAGRQKSHEVLLDFSSDPKPTLAAFQAPRLVLRAPPAWYADLGVFGMTAEEPANYEAYPAEVRPALKRYEDLQKCVVDAKFARKTGGDKAYTVFEAFRPGWLDYGDLPWAEGYCSLHYDWTMSMLLCWLRTGKREFFDAADAMAWIRKDVLQNHSGRCGQKSPYARWANYLTYYEKCDHRTTGQGPKPSHTWNRGIGYYYLLTGDPMARLVCVQTAEGLRGFYAPYVEGRQRASDPKAELRMYGWTIENFLGAYEVTGERKYLDWALGLFRNTFQQIYEKRALEAPDSLAPLMFGYSFEPICRLHYYTGDEKVLATLRYWVDEALLKRFLQGGTMQPDGQYVPYGVPYSWSQTGSRNPQVVWNFFWPNPLAYVYLYTGEARYLEAARGVFRDGVYYYASSWAPRRADQLCNLAYNDNMFAGSYTKAHGWAGRFNQVYLFVEKQLARGVKVPWK